MRSIVIPYRHNTKNGHVELLYAIRSLEKHLKDTGDIFIVGEKINALKGLNYISCKDDASSKFKERNIYRKIMCAVRDKRVTDDFIFTNDDIFLLSDFDDIPFYHKDTLEETMSRNTGDYRKSLNHSKKYLLSKGAEIFDYDTHFPILYNKQKFIDTFAREDLKWDQPFGYVIKSLYCNLTSVNGKFGGDCKVQQKLKYEEIKQKVGNREFFSTSDGSINEDMLRFLEETYPNKSRFEK